MHPKHRHEIDGLRSLAILPVLLFHMGFSQVPGGFLGVDVFFVISGFLITGIIVNELETTGKFSILKFYERRIRRIVPVLLVVTIATMVAGFYILMPNEYVTLGRSVKWMLAFVSNIFFLNQNSYFAPNIDLNPMLHTWSLAIEEQFYVFFPLVLWLLHKYLPKRFWWVAVTGLSAISFLYATKHYASNASEVFYLIQFRAWELMVGALAAIYIKKLQAPKWLAQTLSLLGLAALLGSYLFVGANLPHPGPITLIPVFGAVLVIVFSVDGTLANRVLSIRPLVFIGLISYSLYLWHQPVFAYLRVTSLHTLKPIEFLPALLGVFVLSYLSWKFVENPFRNRSKLKTKKLLSIVGISTVALIVAISVAKQPLSAYQVFEIKPGSTITAGEIEADLAPNPGFSNDCKRFITHQNTCTSPGTGNPTVALWGDSFAMHWVQALMESKTKARFIAQDRSVCTPVIGLAAKTDNANLSGAQACISVNKEFRKYLLGNNDIKTVILASHWDNVMNNITLDDHDRTLTTPDRAKAALVENIRTLKAHGKRVVVILDPPFTGTDLGACIKTAIKAKTALESCNFKLTNSSSLAMNELVSSLSAEADKIITPSDFICPKGTCLVSVGNTIIYRDEYHLSVKGSGYLGRTYDLMGQALAIG